MVLQAIPLPDKNKTHFVLYEDFQILKIGVVKILLKDFKIHLGLDVHLKSES